MQTHQNYKGKKHDAIKLGIYIFETKTELFHFSSITNLVDISPILDRFL